MRLIRELDKKKHSRVVARGAKATCSRAQGARCCNELDWRAKSLDFAWPEATLCRKSSVIHSAVHSLFFSRPTLERITKKYKVRDCTRSVTKNTTCNQIHTQYSHYSLSLTTKKCYVTSQTRETRATKWSVPKVELDMTDEKRKSGRANLLRASVPERRIMRATDIFKALVGEKEGEKQGRFLQEPSQRQKSSLRFSSASTKSRISSKAAESSARPSSGSSTDSSGSVGSKKKVGESCATRPPPSTIVTTPSAASQYQQYVASPPVPVTADRMVCMRYVPDAQTWVVDDLKNVKRCSFKSVEAAQVYIKNSLA